MSRIRAVLFDADGVLQHSREDDLGLRLSQVLGFAPHPLDEFVGEVFEAEKPSLVGDADFAESLEAVVARWGAPGAGVRLAECWWCSIEVDQGLIGLVNSLRARGLCCAVATNQQTYRARYMKDVLSYGSTFDRCICSCDIGFKKPDPRFFDSAVSFFPFAAAEVLFVDDSAENVGAAQGVGLRAARFVHPGAPNSVGAMWRLLQQFGVEASDRTGR